MLVPETVGLDAALGRILAQAVISQSDLPGFDNSAMDGYAVRAGDIAHASPSDPVRTPGRRRIASRSSARGSRRWHRYADHDRRADAGGRGHRGTPGGHTRATARRCSSRSQPQRERASGRSGRTSAAGTRVILPGHALTSIDIGVAAALGHDRLLVGSRPRVALLATGDELVPAGTPPGPAQLVDSNSPMLTAAVREAGGTPTFLGIARDSKDSLREMLEAASASDLVVSSAGVSVGDHDWVREVVGELGMISTWRVAMRPGKPVLIGRLGGRGVHRPPGQPGQQLSNVRALRATGDPQDAGCR